MLRNRIAVLLFAGASICAADSILPSYVWTGDASGQAVPNLQPVAQNTTDGFTFSDNSLLFGKSVQVQAIRWFDVLVSGYFVLSLGGDVSASSLVCSHGNCSNPWTASYFTSASIDDLQLSNSGSGTAGLAFAGVDYFLELSPSASMVRMLTLGPHAVSTWFSGSMSGGAQSFYTTQIGVSLTPTDDPPVPEPRGIALILIAVLGLGVKASRRWVR